MIEEDGAGRAGNGASSSRHRQKPHWVTCRPARAKLSSDFPQPPERISLPTSVEPVKAILSTSGCAARAAPAVSPNPGTIFTTPSGNAGFLHQFTQSQPESGVCSAGLITTVQPVANAGPSFQAAINSGKFQGIICPTTPTGSRRV